VEAETIDVPALLQIWKSSQRSESKLIEAIYPVMRRIAASRLRESSQPLTMTPTDLAHEVFIRMREQIQLEWKDRCQLIALLSTVTRRVVIDHLRQRNADKRHGKQQFVAFDSPEVQALSTGSVVDIQDLDRALTKLFEIDEMCARVAELKVFSDLEIESIAEALSISVSTVTRHWRFARAWLSKEIQAPS
jgi:RNA polymerase sigma factor (TIGR02999 family)